MSAPTSGSAGGSPTPGFYPDPSIPGYIRYWNGAAWVPGTSRPAPAEGEAMPAPPPGAAPPSAPAVEETGPVFFDEEAAGDAALPAVRRSGEIETRPAASWDDPSRLHGTSPEAASAWQADASRQAGFGGETDRRISWGSPDQAPSGAPSGAASWGSVPPQRDEQGDGSASGDLPGTSSSASPAPGKPGVPADGTVAIRAVNPAAPRGGNSGDQGTTAIRAVRPDANKPAKPAKANETMAIRVAGGAGTPSAGSGTGTPQSLPSVGAQQSRPAPQHQAPPQQTPQHQAPQHQAPQHQTPQNPAPQNSAPQNPVQQHPGQQSPAPSAGFPSQGAAAPGPQGAGAEGVIPWKPPAAADPFFAAAQAAQSHPAGLGRRLAARLIDTLVLGAATAAVAVPMWGTVTDHIDAKVEAAKQSGRQVTVYLIDGTTAPVFATILAVLLIGGALYEALPTFKWGRTLGKKLCGVRVLDIEGHDTPLLAAALKRWFLYSVLGILAVGVLNVVWCLFDQPWRQCWHDKLARTFVAADKT
ncbi:RDD family protein [Streptomyces inhibens]|uniref:RDD family protein n=1 Tax=Streptomyces inhibens TaxID=2293571 RepID=A0A371Q2A4_STRIH|nr:RDD family protein [Streptomyces inhibens]REK88822.1 RDD family protein [Streptomyces inhibens]